MLWHLIYIYMQSAFVCAAARSSKVAKPDIKNKIHINFHEKHDEGNKIEAELIQMWEINARVTAFTRAQENEVELVKLIVTQNSNETSI